MQHSELHVIASTGMIYSTCAQFIEPQDLVVVSWETCCTVTFDMQSLHAKKELPEASTLWRGCNQYSRVAQDLETDS